MKNCLIINIENIEDELFQDLIGKGKLDLKNGEQVNDVLSTLDYCQEDHSFCIDFFEELLNTYEKTLEEGVIIEKDIDSLLIFESNDSKNAFNAIFKLKEVLIEYQEFDCYDYGEIDFSNYDFHEDLGLEILKTDLAKNEFSHTVTFVYDEYTGEFRRK